MEELKKDHWTQQMIRTIEFLIEEEYPVQFEDSNTIHVSEYQF